MEIFEIGIIWKKNERENGCDIPWRVREEHFHGAQGC
jgi:hypothetical protein